MMMIVEERLIKRGGKRLVMGAVGCVVQKGSVE
jgi:hypothetical protein